MQYIRFEYKGKTYQGFLDNDFVLPLRKSPFKDISSLRNPIELKFVKILPPVIPSKIVAVGLNYIDHAKELNMSPPKEPLIFLKPPSAVIGTGENIIYPKCANRVDYEAELAIVIGKKTRFISSQDANKHIFGYTCLNDITARDLQKKDGQWARAKSFDSFCPIGPCIATHIKPRALKIELFLNGIIKQSSNTSFMIFSPEKLVSFISEIMTLEKGDIVATGTPPGVGPIKTGDEVHVKIEKIGSLVNRVAAI